MLKQELTPEQLGNRDTIRKNTQRGDEIFKIALDKIVIRDGFNVRTDYGNIQELADSILENGQSQPGRVDVLKEGTFVITDGHRRFKALKLLESHGHECFFKTVINSAKTTEEQRILQMFTTQDNKPLLPHEVAELLKRLVNLGHSQISISKKIGKSNAYVSQMIAFAAESPAIKEHVAAGKLSVSTAVKMQKTFPVQSERVNKVNEIVSAQRDIGTITIKKTTVRSVVRNDEKLKKAEIIAKKIEEHYSIDDSDFLIQLIKENL